jgi:hypothetical protein
MVRPRSGSAHKLGEPVEQRPLAFEDLPVSDRQFEPFGAVDLRKGLHLSTPGRPLDFEAVAPDALNVDVAFDGKSQDPFAATLADLAQRFKRRNQGNTRLLHEFPPGSSPGVLACSHFAFRD